MNKLIAITVGLGMAAAVGVGASSAGASGADPGGPPTVGSRPAGPPAGFGPDSERPGLAQVPRHRSWKVVEDDRGMLPSQAEVDHRRARSTGAPS